MSATLSPNIQSISYFPAVPNNVYGYSFSTQSPVKDGALPLALVSMVYLKAFDNP